MCLSGNKQNVVMWSHYADAHAGLCLGFATRDEFFGMAQPVFYSYGFPEISLAESASKANDKFIEPFILTKGISWEYEDEWRIVDGHGGHGKKEYSCSSLVEVVFGLNMINDHKNLIMTWLAERKDVVKVLQARRGHGYVLEFDEVRF